MPLLLDRPGPAAHAAVPTLATQTVDLRDPRWLTQPRAMARTLREQGRVHRDVQGLWLLNRHADCRAVMQSSHLSRDPRASRAWPALRPFGAGSALEQAAERFMLFNDAPTHTRLRRVVAAAFTPAAVRGLRERIARACDELLAALPDTHDATPFDFMPAFARQLPIRVICELLGIEPGDLERTRAWSDATACVVEPLASRADRAAGAQAVAELSAFLREQVARRRAGTRRVADPAPDVLALMIDAQRADPRFDDDELLANLILLFIAGHETTTNLLGNGLLALLDHPHEMARLRAQPALLPQAVEEMLRYESPTNMVARTTLEPFAVGDLEVPAGEVLYCMIGAAHFDPAVFAEPERFDIGRDPNPQLAFGGGVHYCVGAPLARLEGELAFAALLRRWPGLRRAGAEPGRDGAPAASAAPRWRPMINLRGLESLWVQAC